MLIFLKWVNQTFQILEPIIHFSMFFKQKNEQRKKTRFYYFSFLYYLTLCSVRSF